MFKKNRNGIIILVAIAVLFGGCSDFYSSIGGFSGGSATGTTGNSLPGGGLLLDGYPGVNDVIPSAGASVWYDFSQEMNTATFNQANIQIFDTSNNPVPGYTIVPENTKRFRIDGLALTDGTSYRIVFSDNLEYKDGSKVNQTFEIPFSAGGGASGLIMTGSYPFNGENGISLSPSFNINFNNELNTTTVTTSSIIIEDTTSAPFVVSGYTFSFSADYRIVYINGLALSPDRHYRITLTTGIRDTSGNSLAAITYLNFYTGSGSTLNLTTSNPLDGAMDVPTNPSLTFMFDMELDPATVTSGTVLIHRMSDMANISWATSSLANGNKDLTITGMTLDPGVQYRVTLTTGITALGGGTFSGGDQNIHFTTAPFQLLSHTPVDGDTGFSATGTMTFIFNAVLDPGSITESSVVIYNTVSMSNVSGYSFNIHADGKGFDVYNLSLAAWNLHTVTINAALMSLGGIPFSPDKTITFTPMP